MRRFNPLLPLPAVASQLSASHLLSSPLALFYFRSSHLSCCRLFSRGGGRLISSIVVSSCSLFRVVDSRLVVSSHSLSFALPHLSFAHTLTGFSYFGVPSSSSLSLARSLDVSAMGPSLLFRPRAPGRAPLVQYDRGQLGLFNMTEVSRSVQYDRGHLGFGRGRHIPEVSL